jgi:hypothetical protein
MSTIEIMWLKEYTKNSESIKSGNEIDAGMKKKDAYEVHQTLGKYITRDKPR